jgi:hypothetical protein
LLVKSANLDLPTNDDEHKILDGGLKSVEKEQLRFIKEFWYSKQIDNTRDFEIRNNGLSVKNLYKIKGKDKLSLRKLVLFDTDLFTDFFCHVRMTMAMNIHPPR